MGNYADHINELCRNLAHIQWVADHSDYYSGAGLSVQVLEKLRQYGGNIYTYPQEAQNAYVEFGQHVYNNPFVYMTNGGIDSEDTIYVSNADGYLVKVGQHMVAVGFLKENAGQYTGEVQEDIDLLFNGAYNNYREQEGKKIQQLAKDKAVIENMPLVKANKSLFVMAIKAVVAFAAAGYFFGAWSATNNAGTKGFCITVCCVSLLLGCFIVFLLFKGWQSKSGEKYAAQCIRQIDDQMDSCKKVQEQVEGKRFIQRETDGTIGRIGDMAGQYQYDLGQMVQKLEQNNKHSLLFVNLTKNFLPLGIWYLVVACLVFNVAVGGDFEEYQAKRAVQKEQERLQAEAEKAAAEKAAEEAAREAEEAAAKEAEEAERAAEEQGTGGEDVSSSDSGERQEESGYTEDASGRQFNEDGFLFTDSDSRYLSEDELLALQDSSAGDFKSLLGFARNEIYARKGYAFREDGKYYPYYMQYDWYKNMKHVTVDDSMLNAYEHENIKLIVSLEERFGFK